MALHWNKKFHDAMRSCRHALWSTMKRVNLFLLQIAATCIFTGCGTTGQLGLVTGNSVDPESLLRSDRAYRELGPAWGKMCSSPPWPFTPTDNFARVVDDALVHTGADALLNVTTSTHREPYLTFVFFIPFTTHKCTVVQGTAIKFVDVPKTKTVQ